MKDENLHAWLTSKENQHKGRNGWLALQDLHEGNNNYEVRLSEQLDCLQQQRYTGMSENNASTLTGRLYDIYSKLSRLNVNHPDIDKLRQLATTSKCLPI